MPAATVAVVGAKPEALRALAARYADLLSAHADAGADAEPRSVTSAGMPRRGGPRWSIARRLSLLTVPPWWSRSGAMPSGEAGRG